MRQISIISTEELLSEIFDGLRITNLYDLRLYERAARLFASQA